jgi:hypothetical protein
MLIVSDRLPNPVAYQPYEPRLSCNGGNGATLSLVRFHRLLLIKALHVIMG